MEFPVEYKECPVCKCQDTICRKAHDLEGNFPKDKFLSLEQTMTALQDPTRLATPTIKVVLAHYDVCAKCGIRRCTRAEITSMPVQVNMGPPPRDLRFGRG